MDQLKGRWLQLILGIVGMILIANLQYSWTLFVGPMDAAHHWGRGAIQVAFSVFIITETWLLPIEGYLVDRIGPRFATMAGGVFVALGWSINAMSETLPMLYAGAAVTGLGAGLVYGTAVGNALKWFPDRRGLAAGLTAAGFGAGSALTIIPIAHWGQQPRLPVRIPDVRSGPGRLRGDRVAVPAQAAGRRRRDVGLAV